MGPGFVVGDAPALDDPAGLVEAAEPVWIEAFVPKSAIEAFDRAVWPPIVDGCLILTPAQLALLLEAIDWRRTVPPPLPARPTAI
jgi:hypothetical protein